MNNARLATIWFFGAVFGYSVVYLILFSISGLTATALSIFPVVAVGWYFGMRPAIAAGVVVITLHVLHLTLFTETSWSIIFEQGAPIALMDLIVGTTIGYLRHGDGEQHPTNGARQPPDPPQHKLNTLQQVSMTLSKCDSLKELCRQAVDLGRRELGFDRLSLWLVDDADPEFMLGTYGTDENGNLRDEWGVRLPLSHSAAFRELLDGTVPRYITQDAPLHNYRREVVGHGWNAKTALWSENRGIGWLAEDNLILKREATPEHLEFFDLYSSVLGHLIRRKQVEQSLRDFQGKLKTLHHLSLELAQAEDLKMLCRQAIELGRERLGFDRLGIWLVDNQDPSYRQGTYGIDEYGDLRDEWEVRLLVPETGHFQELLNGTTPHHVWHDSPLYNQHGDVIGQGWNAMTVLWGDDQGVGWLAADNLLKQQPATPEHLELLRLYGLTLGHLIRRKEAETTLRTFQEQLKTLQKVGFELAQAETLKELCRQAVVLGRSELGFDRLGIWLVEDNDPNFMHGAFGIDEFGMVRDEWGVRLPLDPPKAKELLSGKVQYHLWTDAELYDHQHQVVGKGWSAMTVLWGDDHGMGWLSADNLLRRNPVNPQQLELLYLYGSTLGHLIKRKRAEAALRASEERYRALYQDNPSMFFTLDAKGTVISVNDFGAKQLGYEVGELLGQSVMKIFHEDDQRAVTEQLDTCLQNPDQVFQWELQKVRKDGSMLWVEEHARAQVGPGNQRHVLVVCQDVSERKAAEQQKLELAVERKKVVFLQDFLGSMAHDLKTPAAGIEMNVAILESLIESDDTQVWIDNINKQLANLSSIVGDVLTYARLETVPDLPFEAVVINQILGDIQVALHSRVMAKQITLTLALDEDLPPVHANRDELHRAMLNLVENAIKYTPNKGRVNVRTYVSSTDVITEIADTGIGIGEDQLSRVFDEFYRTDNARLFANGTGLGLAITKKIVNLHRGTIRVESTIDTGTTFWVCLPTIDKVTVSE